jgi:hypothetical protein
MNEHNNGWIIKCSYKIATRSLQSSLWEKCFKIYFSVIIEPFERKLGWVVPLIALCKM